MSWLRFFSVGSGLALLWAAPVTACIPGISFDYASTGLDAYAHEEIRYRAGLVQSRPGARLRLDVEVETTGRNSAIMRRRAQIVRSALIRQGVPAHLIEIHFSRSDNMPRHIYLEVISPAPAAGHAGTC